MTARWGFSTSAQIAMAVAMAAALPATPALAGSAGDAAMDAGVGAAGAPGITVTGRGLDEAPATPAYDVKDIPREAITSAVSGRIEDVLSDVAGFQQFRRSDSRSANPSAQGATLRALGGNAASRTLVLLDGVPMSDPMFGSVPFTAIAPERLGNVRVMRGGGSGAFGAGAVAGTVEMDSADAGTLGLLNGEALVDNRAESSLSAVLAPRLGSGFVELGGRWDRGQGFWTTPVSQRVPASAKAAYNSWSTSLRGVAPIAPDVELQGRVMAYDDLRTLRFAGANSTNRGEDASIRLVGRGRWQFDVLAYVQARDFSNVVISSSTYRRTLDQRSTPSTGLGGKVEIRPPVGSAQVMRLGADWRRAEGSLWEDAYNGSTGALTSHRHAGGRNDDVGFFAEDDVKLGSLTLSAGGRADRWFIGDGYVTLLSPTGAVTSNSSFANRADWAFSGRGGAVWRALPGVSLRASAYTGFREPTINELYRTYTVFPVVTSANPNLVNEELKGYEAGLDLAPLPGVTLTATAFYNRLEHAIANVSTGTNQQQRQNVDAIRARGLEFGAAATWGQISFDGSLALTDAVVEAPNAPPVNGVRLNGLRPAQTPKIAASATLAWHPRAGWQLAAVLRHVGMQYEDDLHTSILPAATTLGAFAQVPLGGPFSLVLRGENLADVTVLTRNQAGSMDVGVPRTIWAGIRVGLK